MKKLSKSLSLIAMTLLLVGLLASPGFSDIKFGVKGGLSVVNPEKQDTFSRFER